MTTKKDKLSESEHYFKKTINLNNNFWQAYDFLLKQYDKQSRLKDLLSLITEAKKYLKIMLYFCIMSLYLFRIKDFKKSLNIINNKDFSEKFLLEQNDVEMLILPLDLSRLMKNLVILMTVMIMLLKETEYL